VILPWEWDVILIGAAVVLRVLFAQRRRLPALIEEHECRYEQDPEHGHQFRCVHCGEPIPPHPLHSAMCATHRH
jgi:hypothetical protein